MSAVHADDWLTIHGGDCREVLGTLPDESVQCVVTSPPYWGLRDYGVSGQLGLERTPEEYVAAMVDVFREVRRVLRRDGTLWLVLGDSYAGSSQSGGTDPSGLLGYGNSGTRDVTTTFAPRRGLGGLKPKDLVGIPWRVAFALQADGWYLRSDIIWAKPNPMPESVTDRPTKAHEYLFLLTRSERYLYDADAIREGFADERMGNPGGGGKYMRDLYPDRPHAQSGLKKGEWTKGPETGGRNKRSVWTVATKPYGNVRLLRGPGEHAGGDDSDRIASPDCPVHAGPDRQEPTASRGGRRAAFGSPRSPGSGRRRAPAPPDELAPIGLPLVEDSAPDSSGSPHPAYETSATPHSSESHRTDPAPSTSRHESGVEASSSRTGRTSPPTEQGATSDRIPESSTGAGSGPDVTGSRPSAGTPDRSACTCSYWESVSHFAVFPEALVEPCILAGTSAAGACAECGSPWRRVVERIGGERYATGKSAEKNGAGLATAFSGYTDGSKAPTFITTGWEPTCDHGDAGTVPCVVMDPFAGTGTVGVVAQRLSRRALLIDLNPEYLRQCLARNQQHPLGLEVA